MVQVVSIEDVTIKLGEGVFHENDVRGAGGEMELLAWASAHFSLSRNRGKGGSRFLLDKLFRRDMAP